MRRDGGAAFFIKKRYIFFHWRLRISSLELWEIFCELKIPLEGDNVRLCLGNSPIINGVPAIASCDG